MQLACDLVPRSRLVAILRLERLEKAKELVQTLLDAGIRCIEFTLTNPDATEWVTRLLSEEPRFRDGSACLGVGSVRSVAEAEIAIQSGSQFIVTPIASTAIVDRCKSANVPIAAGAFTPTEIASMWDAGADWVKVFPARNLGPSFIRDVLAPMPYLSLIPTGGIDISSAREYLQAGATAVGVGGSLCRNEWIDAGHWEKVHRAASDIVHAVSNLNHAE